MAAVLLIKAAARGAKALWAPPAAVASRPAVNGSSGGPDESDVHESSLHRHETNRTGGFLPRRVFLLHQAEVSSGGTFKSVAEAKKMA
jgi:hypothetical protein